MAATVTAQVNPLGRTLALDCGDLTMDPNRPTTFGMLEGQRALNQALSLAVETQLGSDPINVTFGFEQLVVGGGAYGVHTRKEYIKLQLVRAVASDRRVKDVLEVYFLDDQRYFDLHPGMSDDVRLSIVRSIRASRTYVAFVAIESIAGGTLTLRAGGPLV